MTEDETNVIIDTGNLAEEAGFDEHEDQYQSDLAATETPTDAKIEFHVSMRSWTQRDMEDLVIAAAAQKLVDGWSDRDLSQRIQDRTVELITKKIDSKLETITSEIINQPVLPKGYGKHEPVTMAEMIGLHAKDYLTTAVDNSGNPSNSSYDKRRIDRLVEGVATRDFDKTLKAERHELLSAAQKAIALKEKEMVAEARADLSKALGRYLKQPK